MSKTDFDLNAALAEAGIPGVTVRVLGNGWHEATLDHGDRITLGTDPSVCRSEIRKEARKVTARADATLRILGLPDVATIRNIITDLADVTTECDLLLYRLAGRLVTPEAIKDAGFDPNAQGYLRALDRVAAERDALGIDNARLRGIAAAAQVLVDFVHTAPGRLPDGVQHAIATATGKTCVCGDCMAMRTTSP